MTQQQQQTILKRGPKVSLKDGVQIKDFLVDVKNG
jgi:hypothetical protein